MFTVLHNNLCDEYVSIYYYAAVGRLVAYVYHIMQKFHEAKFEEWIDQ